MSVTVTTEDRKVSGALVRVRRAALCDLWAYFDDLALDVEDDDLQPEECAIWARGCRDLVGQAFDDPTVALHVAAHVFAVDPGDH